ncbi:MAG: hypothetical protein ACP5U1_07585 [Desulfomonilaceae bacterium]
MGKTCAIEMCSQKFARSLDMRSLCRILILVFLVFAAFSPFNSVEPQDFPYLAPSAPEFDNAGSPVKGPSKSGTQNGIGPKIDPVTPDALKTFGFGPPVQAPEQQTAVNPPARPNRGAQQPGNGTNGPYMPPQPTVRREPEMRHPARQNAPVQQPQTVDCSQYPMLLANARSEAEMQMTARYYLTCLLKQGWLMENAKAQVIQTIESVTRRNR